MRSGRRGRSWQVQIKTGPHARRKQGLATSNSFETAWLARWCSALTSTAVLTTAISVVNAASRQLELFCCSIRSDNIPLTHNAYSISVAGAQPPRWTLIITPSGMHAFAEPLTACITCTEIFTCHAYICSARCDRTFLGLECRRVCHIMGRTEVT